ncbi:endonuclease domain-containing protein [Mucilaginibacter jinjuensis]|uniref:Endonuclease domain-containing protein n=1 Tax=Mucilaginibacter jinjuensis TaxID=1176721 RepID=A0ABY7T872_9SPHI|nr:endonuclease domain-containing protein [Mucilaginibacter jinjuensis]WCT12340.1 endonuclease domain-containing protein [Mucilaginibacter jinjuensis]
MNRITDLCRALRNNQTPAERMLWDQLRRKNVDNHKFLRQYPIMVVQVGISYFYIANFYCAKLKLVIELDGPIHNFKKEYDANRDLVMNQLGIVVLRFNNDEVEMQIDNLIQKITTFISQGQLIL